MQCEALVLRWNGAAPELAGPCGPEPWYIEVGDDEDPVEVVGRLSTNLLGVAFLSRLRRYEYADGRMLLEQ